MPDEPKLITVDALPAEAPWWPWGRDATYRWIREGQLAAVKVGRRYYLTPELLREFVERRVTGGAR